MNKSITAPYIHTRMDINERVKDWGIALLPVLIWSVFIFGARVISLSVIGALFALLLDFPIRYWVLKMPKEARIDLMAAVYGVLAVFAMPVTVPLFLPILSSALVVVAKNIRLFQGKRLFNPFVFSAAILHIAVPKLMSLFTKPFAYFSAFDIVIDPKLIDNYRVISPLQYMADGSVYEDGVIAQFYGFASGHIGEIAIFAMIISLIWLVIKKEADFLGVVASLFTILLLALAFPSDDAESNYYAYSVLLSGGIVFLSVFAMNERYTVPLTSMGKIIFGFIFGCAVFYFRQNGGGTEWGYCIILILNILSPVIEILTKPKERKDTNSNKPIKKAANEK